MKAAEQAITVAKAGRGFSPKHTFDDSVEGALVRNRIHDGRAGAG